MLLLSELHTCVCVCVYQKCRKKTNKKNPMTIKVQKHILQFTISQIANLFTGV